MWYDTCMISRIYFGALIGVTAVLVILVMTTTLVMADSPTDADGESKKSGEIGHHFYTSESGEKEKCEGMVVIVGKWFLIGYLLETKKVITL